MPLRIDRLIRQSLWRRGGRRSKLLLLGFALIISFFYFGLDSGDDSRRDVLKWKNSEECVEKRNFVYIKMIKCASSTLSGVMRRFGLMRNLSFVLPPKGKIYIGWPFEADSTMYRHSKTGSYNIICEHMVYNRDFLKRLMPSDTIYFATLREPFSQFKSTLNYYNVFNISGVQSDDPLAEYIENIDRYEAVYKSPKAAPTRYCIPNGFSMTRNLMSYNLGFPTGFIPGARDMSKDDDFIAFWINQLDKDFHLVLITEYFHESMVLLRRFMCWTLQDILFLTSNKLDYDYRHRADSTLVNKYKQWSKVDYILYNHFNATFWKRLRQQSDDFWREVRHFRKINDAVSRYCHNPDNTVSITIPESVWYKDVMITPSFCQFLHEDLLSILQQNYEKMSPKYDERQPNRNTC